MEERFEDKVKKALAKRLKKARKAADFKSAAAFARSARLNVHQYQDWEAGRHLPDVTDLTRLCKLLRVEPNEMLPLGVPSKAGNDEGVASPRMRQAS